MDNELRKELRTIEEQLTRFIRETEVDSTQIKTDIGYIKLTVAELKAAQSQSFVKKEEFEPIKRLVYGVVSVVLTAVVGGLVALALRV